MARMDFKLEAASQLLGLYSTGSPERNTSYSDWWVGFYGISTFVGYLTPNPFLMKLVLLQTTQFSISTQFKCKYSLIVKNICILSYFV